jgi:hypothetical protein
MRRRVVAFIVVLMVGAITAWFVACTPFSGETEALDAGGDAGDAGAIATDASQADSVVPVAPDAGDGGCVVLTDDFTSNANAWSVVGVAGFDGGVAQLTRGGTYEEGALWRAVPPSTHVELSVQWSYVTTNPDSGFSPADGLTIAWAYDQAVPTGGGSGSDLGFCPNGGSGPIDAVALAIDVRMGLFGVVDSTTCSAKGIAPSYGATFDTSVHQATASVSSPDAIVALTVDAANQKVSALRQHDMPIRYVGFTAGTGGGSAIFEIHSVTLTACP